VTFIQTIFVDLSELLKYTFFAFPSSRHELFFDCDTHLESVSVPRRRKGSSSSFRNQMILCANTSTVCLSRFFFDSNVEPYPENYIRLADFVGSFFFFSWKYSHILVLMKDKLLVHVYGVSTLGPSPTKTISFFFSRLFLGISCVQVTLFFSLNKNRKIVEVMKYIRYHKLWHTSFGVVYVCSVHTYFFILTKNIYFWIFWGFSKRLLPNFSRTAAEGISLSE